MLMKNQIRALRKTISLSIFAALFASVSPAWSAPSKDLLTEELIQNLKAVMETEIVRESIINQNEKYGDLEQSEIDKLDKQWREETKMESQPLVTSILFNPASSYLTRVQAHSAGLYTEIFVMDMNGLNVGQSNITSDFWQGDEDKFNKTYPVSAKAIFIDEPELNEKTNTWRTQINMSISDGKGKAIGAVTVEVNLTELQRRNMGKSDFASYGQQPTCPTPVACPERVVDVVPPATPISNEIAAESEPAAQ